MDAPGLDHAALGRSVKMYKLDDDASHLHGSLCGLLCGGARLDDAIWPAALELDTDVPGWQNDIQLQALPMACRAMFSGSAPKLQPLLPDDDTAARALALIGWCRGFLGGFGLSAIAAGDGDSAGSEQQLSAQANDVLGDIAAIAAFQLDNAAASDDKALATLLEFVGAAAVVLHADARRLQAARALH